MTEIESLLELQELDAECLALETVLRELPIQKDIDELEDRLLTLRERLRNAHLELDRVRKEQKHGEWEAKDITETIDSLSQKLYGGAVTNPREIENMMNRLNKYKSTKNKLEDNVIELMERVETLESEINKDNLEITQKEAERDRLIDKCRSEMGEISSRLADIKKSKEKIRVNISDSSLKKYEQLLKDRGDRVVVPIKGNICGGCHVALPNSIIILAKPNNKITRCENCGRILCWRG